MYLIKFENGGGIRVNEHRLYSMKEEADAILLKKGPPRKKTPWDYM